MKKILLLIAIILFVGIIGCNPNPIPKKVVNNDAGGGGIDVNAPPAVGADQSINVAEDSLGVNFTLNAGTDPNGYDLYYILVTGPTQGTLSGCLNANVVNDRNCKYVPDQYFSGVDAITYKINNGHVDSTSTVTVAFNVTATNHTPTITITTSPVIIDASMTVAEGQLINLLITLDEGGGELENVQSLQLRVTSTDSSIINVNDMSATWNDINLINASGTFDIGDGAFDASLWQVSLLIPPVAMASTDFSGPVTIKLEVLDGSVFPASSTFLVTLTGQNTPPTIVDVTGNQIIPEGSPIFNHRLSIDEGGGPSENTDQLKIRVTTSDAVRIPRDGISAKWGPITMTTNPLVSANTLEFNVGDKYNDAALYPLYLSLIPDPDLSTTTPVTITVAVSDDGIDWTVTTSFTVTITAVNDEPYVYNPAAITDTALTFTEGSQASFNLVVDEGGGFDEDPQEVTINITSGNTNVVENTDIKINGGTNSYTTTTTVSSFPRLAAIIKGVTPSLLATLTWAPSLSISLM